ncbi:neuroserpin-like [Venturia canescens]|uniref:neuroserpin-like n=1 Tax=Venturia canescens TaxID=32260 RepID=UPI001C9C03F0|nr:neuroserpin-like [Venturia canescens]
MYHLSVSLLGMVSLLSVAVFTKSLDSVTSEQTAVEAVLKDSSKFADEYIQTIGNIARSSFAVSPFGINLVLFLISFGLDGYLKARVNYMLSRNPNNLDKNGYGNVIDQLNEQSALRIANSFFVDSALNLKLKFISAIPKAFHLEVHNTSFANTVKLIEKMNKWCEKHTGCRIANRLKLADVVLNKHFSVMNAVSFEGTWLQKFDITETRLRPFYFNNGTVKELPTMRISGKFRTKMTPLYSIVELPLKRDVRHNIDISMVVVFPTNKMSLSTFKIVMRQYVSNRPAQEEINIELPRFVIPYRSTLKKSLEKLGLNGLFEPNAKDFLGRTNYMGGGAIFSDDMEQTNVFYVDEEGVEAVSAIGCNAVRRRKQSQWTAPNHIRDESKTNKLPNFIVNRPFYAMITTSNNINLFTVSFGR